MPKNKSSKPRGRGRDRRAHIRADRREQPDLTKIAHVIQALALAQAEKDAQAENEKRRESRS